MKIPLVQPSTAPTREDFAAFGPYCRQLNLRFATWAVLTPLRGTELLEEVRDQLITTNYNYP